MDTYRLNDLQATVGMFGDFSNFKDVIDYIFETNPFKKALDIFDCDDVGDGIARANGLDNALAGELVEFDEDLAKDLCMDCLDGEDVDDEDPEAEWGDEMYCRAAGK